VSDDELDLLFDLPTEILEFATYDEPVVVVNLEGVVVTASKPAQDLFGYSAEDIVGEFVEQLMAKDMRWGHQAYRRGFLAEPNDREMDPGLEPHGQRADGTLVPIHVRLQPLRVGGNLYVAAHVSERAEQTEHVETEEHPDHAEQADDDR